jgi:hypothetical protein
VSIVKPAVKLIVREYARCEFHGLVLLLGVPEVYATPREL